MKKRIIIIISLMCFMIVTTIFTTAANNSEFYYEGLNTTVSFDSSSTWSYEQKQMIADKIIYGNANNEGVSTYRWCWLIGHDKVKDTVIVTEHKVDEKHPRCIKRIYDVETCTACDYIKETLISETYIVCCPED